MYHSTATALQSQPGDDASVGIHISKVAILCLSIHCVGIIRFVYLAPLSYFTMQRQLNTAVTIS